MRFLFALIAILGGMVSVSAAEPVTLDNLVRAESDTALRTGLKQTGASVGELYHSRGPTPVENQPIIRMNRDTLYSSAVVDLSKPVTITLPETGDRYMSMHIVNQDHYMFVITEPGEHTLGQDEVGTRYALITIRTFVNPNDSEDVAAVNALQDQIKLTGGARGELELPNWNQEQLKVVRQSLNALAPLGLDAGRAFGKKGEVDPIHFYVGAISGWGGLPKKYAVYTGGAVDKNDGTPYSVTVKDVPVDAFWSITIYNKDGYLEKNDRDAYSFNSVTAEKSDDGSITIHFGDCDDGRVNCLPITEGWNYTVRLYQPRKEILDGSWTFPELKPLK